MEKKKEIRDFRSYYLKEFQYFDGENDITFNIVDIDFDNRSISIAVTDCGKIYIREFDLLKDDNGNYYFNYGIMLDEIRIDDFETITDSKELKWKMKLKSLLVLGDHITNVMNEV